MHGKLMSFGELRNRLLDRILMLEERISKTPRDPDGSRNYLNVKTELNTAKRRLRLLDEKATATMGAE